MLGILRLKICFVILIPRPEKEQNPCSAGNQKSKELQRAWSGGNCFIMSYDGFFISGFPVLDGLSTRVSLLTSRAPSSSPQGVGLVSCPRRGHPSGRQGGQRGCREALPAREPGDHGFYGPQPRN